MKAGMSGGCQQNEREEVDREGDYRMGNGGRYGRGDQQYKADIIQNLLDQMRGLI